MCQVTFEISVSVAPLQTFNSPVPQEEVIWSSVIPSCAEWKTFTVYRIHHTTTALFWFCQKFQFYGRFLPCLWGVCIAALSLPHHRSPRSHRWEMKSLPGDDTSVTDHHLAAWHPPGCLLPHTQSADHFTPDRDPDSRDVFPNQFETSVGCEGFDCGSLCFRYCSGGAVGPRPPTGQLQSGELHLPGNAAQHRQDCFCV